MNSEQPSNKVPRWLWVVLGNIAAAVIGGILVVQYTQWMAPAPGLSGTGELVLYVPRPPDNPRPGDLELWSFWRVAVRNTGTRPARNVRLSIPASEMAVWTGGVKLNHEDAERGFTSLALGNIEPGAYVNVFGWIRPKAAPSILHFALMHSEGYGDIEVVSIPAYQARKDRSDRVLNIMQAATSGALLAFLVLFLYRFRRWR